MKKLIFLFILFCSCVPLPAQVYIDPSASVNGSGTQASPLNGSTFIVQYGQPFKTNQSYLFKRGTTFSTSYAITPAAGCTLGAYGQGERPVIKSSCGNTKCIDNGSKNNVIIQDLEIYSTNNAITCIWFVTATGGQVINCKLHDTQWGLRMMNNKGLLKVMNCEIYNTQDDGCFIANNDSLEFASNYVHDVNILYLTNKDEKVSGGDCLQLGNIKWFYIHDNILDHSKTGNKFCLILNSDIVGFVSSGLIERNTFRRDGSGYLFYTDYSDNKNMKLQYNKFQNAMEAIDNHSKNLQIYYNEFSNITGMSIDGAGGAGSTSNVINNTFFNVNNVVTAYSEAINFKNNIVYQTTGTAFVGGSKLTLDYNDYFKVNTFGGTKGSHDISIDPLFANLSTPDLTPKNTLVNGMGAYPVIITTPTIDQCKPARDSVKNLLNILKSINKLSTP